MGVAQQAPGLLDHYLANVVYEGHQTDTPETPGRRDNLWEPVPGDHGAHGPFDGRAKSQSLQLWATTHRAFIAAAAAAVGAGAVLGSLLGRTPGAAGPHSRRAAARR